MPEEQNRYIADYLSDYLIAPTINAYKNINEFRKLKIYITMVMLCMTQ